MIDNDDGTVTDKTTGLMWQQETPDAMTWKQALSYCEKLSLAGYTDWRLPTIRELINIVDYSRYIPAINTKYFPDAQSAFYWSSTTFAYGTSDAWGVNFDYGYVNFGNKSLSYYVRAVREIYGAVQIKKE